MIWTAEGNKKLDNKADDNPLFQRENNQARDEFLERVQKEIKGVEIKDVTTPAKVNPIEKLVRLNNRDVAHVTNRAQMFFGIGLRTSNGNRI